MNSPNQISQVMDQAVFDVVVVVQLLNQLNLKLEEYRLLKLLTTPEQFKTNQSTNFSIIDFQFNNKRKNKNKHGFVVIRPGQHAQTQNRNFSARAQTSQGKQSLFQY